MIPREEREGREVECLLILNRINTTLGNAREMVLAIPSCFNRQMLIQGVRMSLDMIEKDLATARGLGSSLSTHEIMGMVEEARAGISRLLDQEAPLS